MLSSRFSVQPITGAFTADHTNASTTRSVVPHSLAVDFSPLQLPLLRSRRRCRCPKSILISCNSSRNNRSSSFGDHQNSNTDNNDFLEASLLLSETISHYHMWRRHRLQWNSPTSSSVPLPNLENSSRSRMDNTLFRQGFLQRFQSPTIFLKISCQGDYILPIVVGDIAVQKLINAEDEQESEDCPEQFQFVKDLVERLDHRVIMVSITERVVSTYFARLYLSQPGKRDIISVDARPSDAINVANRCKAPIYVSKQIVLTDAIRLGYGIGRVHNKKVIYDVLLDSAADGPDFIAQELSMMQSMHLAIKQERFQDAATWRDKLENLRKSSHEH